jgi:hypothetical protein
MYAHQGFWMRRGSRGNRGTRRVGPRLDMVGMARDHILEPRTLLSTIVVSNPNDSGPGSLRSAVADATNGDSIVFSNRLAGRTITLQSEIEVTNNISISGPASRPVVLSGGGKSRVLEIDGATVSLANLVVTQGSAAIGGGILDSAGSLSLSHVLFTGNVADGSATQVAQGGAIDQQSGGSLSINHSTFTGNRVIGDPQSSPPQVVIILPITPPPNVGGEADGGAIADFGTLLIRSSNFNSNMAIGGPVQTNQTTGVAQGGAIYVASATMTSSGSTFEGNQTIGGNFVNTSFVGAKFAAGGANGGAIASISSAVTLLNNTIRLNTAHGGDDELAAAAGGGDGGYGSGGAIALMNGSTLTVLGGTISGNQALGGFGVGPGNSQPTTFVPSGLATGGGIASQDTSSVSIYGSTFSNNVARSGGPSNAVTPTSYAYAGDAWGGAINFNGTGNLALTQVKLRGNEANGGSSQFSGQASGGGLAVESAGSVTIADSVLQGNLAETGQAVVPTQLSVNSPAQTFTTASGGGIYVIDVSGTFSLVHSQIDANRAIGTGNGVATGGGLALYNSQVNLVKDTLQSNAAIGGSIVTNSTFGQASGGAVAFGGQTMTVTDSNFLGNQAMTATVNQKYEASGGNDASEGGAILNNGRLLQIFGGSFIGNRAQGGAGLAGSQGANGQGGAIYSIGTAPLPFLSTPPTPVLGPATSFVRATGVEFQNNLASGGAGAAQSSATSPAGGVGQGGAIDNEQYSSLDLSSSTVVSNQAIGAGGGQGHGGGLYLAPISLSTLVNDMIVGNRATTSNNDIDNLGQ